MVLTEPVFSCSIWAVLVRKITCHIDLIFCIRPCCIKPGCRQLFPFFCAISIGKPGCIFPIPDLTYPSAKITLVDIVIIVSRFNSRVYNIMDSNISIIIRYIKISLISEIFAPAVSTYKGSVSFQIHIKIFFREIIIPAYDHRIMVRLLRTNIAIGIGVTIVINRLTFIILHRCI